MLLPFITQAQHAVKIRIQTDVFSHHCSVNEWVLWEAEEMADMKGFRTKKREGKCGFDLEFRLKIHQDLLCRCICQAGGDTQSGLHNHILFGSSRAQVCVFVYLCAWPCKSASKANTKSIFITAVTVTSQTKHLWKISAYESFRP